MTETTNLSFSYKVKEEDGTKVIHSPMFTSGIAYLSLIHI